MDKFYLCAENGVKFYKSMLFEKYGIPHVIGTRAGGVSSGCFESLNVSTNRKNEQGFTDSAENVEENFTRLISCMGKRADKSVSPHQIHSATVKKAGALNAGCGVLQSAGSFDECDGVYCEKGDGIDALCVKSADCVPILLYNTKRDIACAVHAGWRGTCANICKNAVEKIAHGNAGNIVAIIGPCIHSCCYEVSEDVVQSAKNALLSCDKNFSRFSEIIKDEYVLSGEKKYKISLANINFELLKYAGVPQENIDIFPHCTCCFKEDERNVFFSHRAQNGHSGTFACCIACR